MTNEEENELLEQIIMFISKNTNEKTNIYVGSDSKNLRGMNFTQFVVAIVIHYEGNKGAKVFGIPRKEKTIKSVNQRLMMEAYYALEIALKLKDVVYPRPLSVHLDVNKKDQYKSSNVFKQATGMVYGQGLNFKVKPYAIAATSAADHLSNYPGKIKEFNKF